MLQADGSRVLLDCGPGVLGRLRQCRCGRRSTRSRSPTSISTTGATSSVGLGHFYLGHGTAPCRSPALWVQPGGDDFLAGSASGSGSRTCSSARSSSGVRARRAVHDRQARGHAAQGSPLHPADVRVPRHRTGRLTYWATRRPRRSCEAARDADLFVCEATLAARRARRGAPWHLSLDEAVEAFDASGAKRLLVTHRPRELPTPDEFELAYDGLELELV